MENKSLRELQELARNSDVKVRSDARGGNYDVCFLLAMKNYKEMNYESALNSLIGRVQGHVLAATKVLLNS